MQEVLQKLDTKTIVNGHVGTPPSTSDAKGSWFYASLHAPDKSPLSQCFAEWQGYVAQGAISAKLSAAKGAGQFVGSTFKLDLADGSTLPDIETAGDAATASPATLNLNSESDSQISDRIESIVSSYQMRILGLVVYRPLYSAIAVTIEVSDTQLFAGKAGPIVTTIQRPLNPYEAYFIDFVNSAGQQLSIQFADTLVGVGAQWILPGHDEYGTAHGGLAPEVAPATTSK